MSKGGATRESPPERMVRERRALALRSFIWSAALSLLGVSTLLLAGLVEKPTLATGVIVLAQLIFFAGLVMLVAAFYWIDRAGAAKRGVRSEAAVGKILARLEAKGWQIHRNWAGVKGSFGDVDYVAVSPSSKHFAIEVKTSEWSARKPETLRRAREQGKAVRRGFRSAARVPAIVCYTKAKRFRLTRWQQEEGVYLVRLSNLSTLLRRLSS